LFSSACASSHSCTVAVYEAWPMDWPVISFPIFIPKLLILLTCSSVAIVPPVFSPL